ncbi:hypothetical protein [Paraburkholderia fungorum]|uniref:hypothetical protein n=1 Tax=Paraburkholderia fungorum TaxID=134537 RepID=UPI001615026E|nr:hypothetical protein [Paraburkholderia fungorum]MBB5543576.1 hypothetical protein [Paraburkholderia fungorum]
MTDEQIDELVTRYFGAGRYHFAPSRYRAFARELLSATQPAAVDREAAMRDRARRFVKDFMREMGFSMSDHAQEVMLNLFLQYAAPLDKDASKPAVLDRGYVTALIKRMQDYCDSLAPPMARGLMAEAVRALVATSPAAPSVEQDERGACVVSDNCKWPACRRDCVFDSRAQHARAASTSANVAQGAEGADTTLYVEVRECYECNHIGINDARANEAACGNPCGWHGPEPDLDKCPGCLSENVMSASCPKCGGYYRLLVDSKVSAPPAQTALTDEQIGQIMQLVQHYGDYRWAHCIGGRAHDAKKATETRDRIKAALTAAQSASGDAK